MKRRMASTVAWLALLLPCAACPPSEVRVEVSTDGAQRVLTACTPSAANNCMTTTPADFLQPLTMQAFLLNADGVAATGTCVALELGDCLDLSLAPDEATACLRARLNGALDGAMKGGLTFSDLEDDSDATLIVTTHGSSPECGLDALLSCAVFQVPLGGKDYDVGCAVCAGGPPTGVGCTLADNCVFGECIQPDDCALDLCRRILQ